MENVLREILDPGIMDLSLEGESKDEVLRNLAARLLEQGYIDNTDQFVSDIYDREAEGATGVGQGISIPHGHSSASKKIGIAVGKTVHPVDWESDISDTGWQKTRMIFLFCVPVDREFAANHQLLLSRLAMKLGSEARCAKLPQCETAQEIIDLMLCDDEELEQVDSAEEIVDLDLDL